MVLTQNTILITGGSSGIGLELAKSLHAMNNKIIICGRDEGKLRMVKETNPYIYTYRCDISVKNECMNLAEYIKLHHPECNVLINNAAIAYKTNFYDDGEIIAKAENEIFTNLLAPIYLSKYLLPVIEKNTCPALINISTGLVYAPRFIYPIYNATKSGLHIFTQTLRNQLKVKNIKVFEIMFPAVITPWHKGAVPENAMSVEKAVKEMLKKLEKGKVEIKIGKVALLAWIARFSPSLASRIINN